MALFSKGKKALDSLKETSKKLNGHIKTTGVMGKRAKIHVKEADKFNSNTKNKK